MPSPERGLPSPNDPPHRGEVSAPYRRAPRFRGNPPARRPYPEPQPFLYPPREPPALSFYPLQPTPLWFVPPLGSTPPAPVLVAIERTLASGKPATLPEEVWHALDAH